MKKNYSISCMGMLCVLLSLLALSQSAHAQKWTKKKDMPFAGRWGGYSFSVNGKVYVGGGYLGNLQNMDDLWEYDPSKDSWTQKAKVPGTVAGRTDAVAFAINGKGYIGLGAEGFNSASTTWLADMWEYDPGMDKWTQKKSLPDSGRSAPAWFVVGNKVYVTGGSTAYAVRSSDTWEYNPSNDTWTNKAAYPFPVNGAGGFAIGNKGYVAGGRKKDSTFYYSTKILNEYDVATNTWTQKADYCDTLGREYGVCFVLGNKAYFGLGQSGKVSTSFFYNEFCSYNPATNKWNSELALPGQERAYPTASVANNKAYAGAGFIYSAGQVYKNDWYEYDAGIPNDIDDKLYEQSVKIYPNPATSALHVDIENDNTEYRFELRNIIGQIVVSGLLAPDNIIDVSNISDGYYILKISSDKGQVLKPVTIM